MKPGWNRIFLNEPDWTRWNNVDTWLCQTVKNVTFLKVGVKVIRGNKIIFRIMISTLVSTVITPTVPPDYLTIISYLTRIQFHSCWKDLKILFNHCIISYIKHSSDTIWPQTTTLFDLTWPISVRAILVHLGHFDLRWPQTTKILKILSSDCLFLHLMKFINFIEKRIFL